MGGFFILGIFLTSRFIFVHGLNGLITCYAAGIGFGFPEDICTLADA